MPHRMIQMLSDFMLVCLCVFVSCGHASADPLSDADRAVTLRQYSNAVSIYTPLAEQGHAEAQYQLGQLYHHGRGVPQDNALAIKWYQLAAEHGNISAQNDLGHLYADGKLAQKDLKAAFTWLEKAALAEQPNAQTSIGWAYMSSYLELAPDYKLAMEWNLKAANQGFGEGSSNVGMLYEKGWGVPVNFTEAIKWYRKAIDQGIRSAQTVFRLAELYETGHGVEKDLDLAAKLYQATVDSGDEEYANEAQTRLLFIQGQQELKSTEDIRYPQEVTPPEDRPSLMHGKTPESSAVFHAWFHGQCVDCELSL